MSYLLFMDESGHHGGDGFEVRGGIALEARRVWSFTRQMRGLESKCFGDLLANHGKELKGVKLLERKRIRLAATNELMSDDERQSLCLEYLGQARNGVPPTLKHNIAYAQASVLFVEGLLHLVRRHEGRVFAGVVPGKHVRPPKQIEQNFVRRDIKYLMAAFNYYCEELTSDGLLVLDETDRTDDRRFLRRLEIYFSVTADGQRHSRLILPTPLFTESTMSYPVQAADILCYIISHGFQLGAQTAPSRSDLPSGIVKGVEGLKFRCVRTVSGGGPKTHHSIIYVDQPWSGAKRGEGKTHLQNNRSGDSRGRASNSDYTPENEKSLGCGWREPK